MCGKALTQKRILASASLWYSFKNRAPPKIDLYGSFDDVIEKGWKSRDIELNSYISSRQNWF